MISWWSLHLSAFQAAASCRTSQKGISRLMLPNVPAQKHDNSYSRTLTVSCFMAQHFKGLFSLRFQLCTFLSYLLFCIHSSGIFTKMKAMLVCVLVLADCVSFDCTRLWFFHSLVNGLDFLTARSIIIVMPVLIAFVHRSQAFCPRWLPWSCRGLQRDCHLWYSRMLFGLGGLR